MEFTQKHIGKIVEMPPKPEWGPGVVSKLQSRFVYVVFKNAESRAPKRFFATENILRLAADQDRAKAKRNRSKGKKTVQAVPAS